MSVPEKIEISTNTTTLPSTTPYPHISSLLINEKSTCIICNNIVYPINMEHQCKVRPHFEDQYIIKITKVSD